MMDIEQSEETQYSGYQLKSVADFELEQVPDDLHGNQATAFVMNQYDVNLHTTDNDVADVVCASFSVAYFLAAMIFLAIGADCKFGLCEWTDSSSLANTIYNFQVLEFVAPLKFVWGSLLVVCLSMSVALLMQFIFSK